MSFLCSSAGKESACNVADPGSWPWFNSWVRKIPCRRIGYPFQNSWIPQSEDFCLQKVREINKNNWCIPFILVAQTVKNLPAMQETWVWSLGQKGHREKEWQPTPVFLAGEFHEQRSMAGCRPCGHKQSDRTVRLTLFTFYPDSQILNILQHALTFSLCEVDISFSEPFETRLYTLCLNNSVFFLRTRIY